ncbi:alcohol dehydrogenase catalytic domain-containing protein [Sorangium sp. So ce429]
MKAVVFDVYGPPEVLQLAEVDKPAPGNREVLVRIRATTVTAEDPKMRGFKHPPLLWLPIGLLFGFRRPRKTILGTEFAGEVEAVGKDVTLYRKGDPVFGYTGTSFGRATLRGCFRSARIGTGWRWARRGRAVRASQRRRVADKPGAPHRFSS